MKCLNLGKSKSKEMQIYCLFDNQNIIDGLRIPTFKFKGTIELVILTCF